jgi:hypothetical protein
MGSANHRVSLAGNLALQEARAVWLQAKVAEFDPCLWYLPGRGLKNVPLLLGQVNFFEEFDVFLPAFTVSIRD